MHALCVVEDCPFDLLDDWTPAVKAADAHTAETGHTVIVKEHTEPPC